MEKRCGTCVRTGEPITNYICFDCVKSGNRSKWEPKCPEFIYKPLSKATLNYLYGRTNMNVDDLYPKLEKPIYIGTGPALPINNEIVEYLKNDVEATMEMFMAGGRSNGKTLRTLEDAAKKIGCRVVAESWFKSVNMPGIDKVIFSGPATIVFWNDGTKTVVKAQEGELFDPEKGLAMAISKKVFGNQGNYFEEFKKWIPEEKEPITINFDGEALKNAVQKASEAIGHAAENIKKMRFE